MTRFDARNACSSALLDALVFIPGSDGGVPLTPHPVEGDEAACRKLVEGSIEGGRRVSSPEDLPTEKGSLGSEVPVVIGEEDRRDEEPEGGIRQPGRHRILEELRLDAADPAAHPRHLVPAPGVEAVKPVAVDRKRAVLRERSLAVEGEARREREDEGFAVDVALEPARADRGRREH